MLSDAIEELEKMQADLKEKIFVAVRKRQLEYAEKLDFQLQGVESSQQVLERLRDEG